MPGTAPLLKRSIKPGSHFAPGQAEGPLGGKLAGLATWPATAAVSFVAGALSWRWQAWEPVRAGLNSWQAGLSLAFLHHLQWGPQVIFTFGPYGFLEDAVPFSRLTAAAGVAYWLALRWALAALVVAGLRRSWGIWAAGAGAWLAVGLAANLAEAPELAPAVAFGLLLGLLPSPGPAAQAAGAQGGSARAADAGEAPAAPGTQEAGSRRAHLLLGLLGGLAGLQLLVEVTTGLVCAGLAGLGALAVVLGKAPGRPLRRAAEAAAAAGGPLATAVLALLGAGGQSLANLASYLRGSFAVVAGYTPAMSLSTGRRAEDWCALVELAALGALYGVGLRRRPWPAKLAVSLGLGGWAWELAKEGFVRHDLHDLTFFGLMAAAAALAPLRRSWGQVGALVLAAVLAFVANAGVPLALRSPLESTRALVSDVADLASAKDWAGVVKVARRQAQRSGDAVPGRLLDALAKRSFAVEPLEDSMSFAFPALKHWDPEPVLQAYSAYTPYLDHLDSTFLASQRAPQLILYRPASVAGQDPAWEPPAATEAMYCRYSEEATAGYWVLLARVADRCGRPHLLGRAVGRFGQPFTVPAAPGEMVLARFSLALPATTGLEDLFWKAPAVYVATWSGPAGTAPDGRARRPGALAGAPKPAAQAPGGQGLVKSTWRFVATTAGDAHVLSAPLGWTRGYGPANVRRLEFFGGGWPAGQGKVEVSFYAAPLSK